jgi:short-subunit dehydrogenase
VRAGSFGARYGGAALVTGASAGIGEAFAQRLAQDGTDLVLVARRTARLEALARTLAEAHAVRAHVLAMDLTVPGAVPRLVDELAARKVEVGLLVHNAGFGSAHRFHETDPGRLTAMVDLHCRVPVELTRALVPAMIGRGRGAVILVASVAAYLASPSDPVYGASKAFDLHLAEGLAAQLGPLGIDVLAVSPGYTRTEFHEAAGIDASRLPRFAWSRAGDVAKTALERLGRNPSVVVDRKWRAVAALIRLLPRGLVNRVSGPLFFRKVAPRAADDRGRRPGTGRPPGETER